MSRANIPLTDKRSVVPSVIGILVEIGYTLAMLVVAAGIAAAVWWWAR